MGTIHRGNLPGHNFKTPRGCSMIFTPNVHCGGFPNLATLIASLAHERGWFTDDDVRQYIINEESDEKRGPILNQKIMPLGIAVELFFRRENLNRIEVILGAVPKLDS